MGKPVGALGVSAMFQRRFSPVSGRIWSLHFSLGCGWCQALEKMCPKSPAETNILPPGRMPQNLLQSRSYAGKAWHTLSSRGFVISHAPRHSVRRGGGAMGAPPPAETVGFHLRRARHASLPFPNSEPAQEEHGRGAAPPLRQRTGE